MDDKGFWALFTSGAFLIALVVMLNIGFWVFVVWAIYKLVMHFTGG